MGALRLYALVRNRPGARHLYAVSLETAITPPARSDSLVRGWHVHGGAVGVFSRDTLSPAHGLRAALLRGHRTGRPRAPLAVRAPVCRAAGHLTGRIGWMGRMGRTGRNVCRASS